MFQARDSFIKKFTALMFFVGTCLLCWVLGSSQPVLAKEGAKAKQYKIQVKYDKKLCSVEIKNDDTEIKNGSYVDDQSHISVEFTIKDDRYRIEKVSRNGNDCTDTFVEGGYGFAAYTVTEDSTIELKLAKIPDTLPVIQSASIYYDYDYKEPVAGTDAVVDDEDDRFYGKVKFEDRTDYPSYYSMGMWQYSWDGQTWNDAREWGVRTDFWPAWYNKEWVGNKIDFLGKKNYYLRLHVYGRNGYCTGDIYTIPIFVNSDGTVDKKEFPPVLGSDEAQQAESNKQQIKTAKVKTYKASALKKSNVAFALNVKVEEKGKITYKVTGYPQNAKQFISVNEKGVVTLKKGAKKGTYKVKITVGKTKNFAVSTKTVSIKVK